MIYGSKITIFVLLLSFFFLTACSNTRDFSYNLYDGYEIKSINQSVKLYKDEKFFEINDLDYQIKEFKYNSDVVCLELSDGNYYMIYYVDGMISGPHTLDSLESEIKDLSMTFDNDFEDIMKVEGKVYE